MDAKPRFLVIAMIFGAAAAVSIGSAVAGQHDEQGSKAWLGVSVEEETDHPDGGARVTWVIDDSPAAQIGLQRGDIIVSLDGTRVYGPGALTKAIRSNEPGRSIEIEIVRDGQNQALSVELGERPRSWSVRIHGEDDDSFHFEWDEGQFEEQMEQMRENLENLEHFNVAPRVWTNIRGFGHRPKLGVQLTEVTPELREHLGGQPDAGVLVGKVMKGMPAEMAGVEVGDLIDSVDGATIEDTGDLVEVLHEKAGETIQLGIVRDGRPMSIDVFIPDPHEETEAKGPRA